MASATGYLLDTNILVALMRNNAIGKAIEATYALSSSLHVHAISVVVAGEMHSLASQFGWGDAKRKSLESMLEEIVWVDINHPKIIHRYGEIDAASRADGAKMTKNDLWIAATASVTGLTLLTTDKDFDFVDGRFLTRIWIDPAGV